MWKKKCLIISIVKVFTVVLMHELHYKRGNISLGLFLKEQFWWQVITFGLNNAKAFALYICGLFSPSNSWLLQHWLSCLCNERWKYKGNFKLTTASQILRWWHLQQVSWVNAREVHWVSNIHLKTVTDEIGYSFLQSEM